MARRPRDIGTSAETAVKRWLQDDGWPDCERRPLAGNRDEGDLTVCRSPLIIAEVKAGATADKASDNLIREWLEQTETERANAGAELAVLVVRRFRRPVGAWDAWMPMASWVYMCVGYSLPWVTQEAPWPLRASLADWSTIAKEWEAS